jgi:hypothetical protein
MTLLSVCPLIFFSILSMSCQRKQAISSSQNFLLQWICSVFFLWRRKFPFLSYFLSFKHSSWQVSISQDFLRLPQTNLAPSTVPLYLHSRYVLLCPFRRSAGLHSNACLHNPLSFIRWCVPITSYVFHLFDLHLWNSKFKMKVIF